MKSLIYSYAIIFTITLNAQTIGGGSGTGGSTGGYTTGLNTIITDFDTYKKGHPEFTAFIHHEKMLIINFNKIYRQQFPEAIKPVESILEIYNLLAFDSIINKMQSTPQDCVQKLTTEIESKLLTAEIKENIKDFLGIEDGNKIDQNNEKALSEYLKAKYDLTDSQIEYFKANLTKVVKSGE